MQLRWILKTVAASALSLAAACNGSGAPPAPLVYAFSSNLDAVEPGFEPDQLLAGFSLGLDFDVLQGDIEVTSLGVFDWQEDGLASDHTVRIYDRTGVMVASVDLPAGGGTLQGGFRYVDLAAPVLLEAGFEGTIVVGYPAGNLDRNANVHGDLAIDPPPLFDDGDGLLASVGSGRYAEDPDAFPDVVDDYYGALPPNRYHAGSLAYRPLP
ncbi:MAG: hypothetical protein ACT4PV_05595 [Planctomycetaceae bacterium]